MVDYSHTLELDDTDGGITSGSTSLPEVTKTIAASAVCATEVVGAKAGSVTTKDIASASNEPVSFVDFGVLTSTSNLIIYISNGTTST